MSASFFVSIRKLTDVYKHALIGPKHNLFNFKHLWWWLFIESWYSSQYLYAGKGCNGNLTSIFPPYNVNSACPLGSEVQTLSGAGNGCDFMISVFIDELDIMDISCSRNNASTCFARDVLCIDASHKISSLS